MDDQPMREFEKSKATRRRASPAAQNKGTAEPATASVVSETIAEAATTVRNVGEQAWSAASDAGTAAQDLTRRARDQASAASDTLYREGARAGDYLMRNVNRYPLSALLIAGAIGYLAAHLIHPSRPASEGAKAPVIDR